MGTLIAIAVPLVLLLAVAALGKGGMRTAPLVLFALLWGVGSTWIIVHINGWWARSFSLTSLYVLGAPIIEEIGKSLFSPVLTAMRRCSWFVDGAVIGLAAGMGFAIRENLVYLQHSPNDSVGLAIARVTSTNLMHAGCSALVGAALALSARRGVLTRIASGLGGLIIAMAIHSGFNRLTRVSVPSPLIITMMGVLAFAWATLAVAAGIPVSERWAKRDMEARGLSESESAALSGGSSVDEVLDEFETRFGAAALEVAEELIAIQRRIGVLSRGGRGDDPEIGPLTEKADDLRRRLGVFPMMWLRSHLPVNPTEAGVWADLGASVTTDTDEPVAAPSGLWASLGAVTAPAEEPSS